MLPNGEINK